MKFKIIVGIVALVLVLPILFSSINVQAALNKKVIGDVVYWDQARGSQSIQNNLNSFSEVSPFWYYPDSSGRVLAYPGGENSTIISYLKNNNIKIVPTVANILNGQWNGPLVSKIINDPVLASANINNIVNLVVSKGYDGIDLDYEDLSSNDRTAFSKFVQDLANALHTQGKILAVDVYAKTSEPGSWGGPQAQDWTIIGQAADEVRLMTYEYHWSTSPAGPISPVNWVDSVLAFAVSKIPSSKVMHGVSLYGYDWVGSNGIDKVWSEIMNIASTYGSTINWDATSMEPWFQYTNSGTQHTVWFSNASSTDARLSLTNKYNLGGIFLWRLGGEDPSVWNVIQSKFSTSTPPSSVTADIKANNSDGPINITTGSSANISWISTNANNCSVSPSGWTGLSNSGISTGNIISYTTYVLTCSGAGGVVSDSVAIDVSSAQINDYPYVDFTTPINGANVSGKSVQVLAIASDNGGISKVEFYVDSKLSYTDTAPQYGFWWNIRRAATGAHTLKAVAYDKTNLSSSTQITVYKSSTTSNLFSKMYAALISILE